MRTIAFLPFIAASAHGQICATISNELGTPLGPQTVQLTAIASWDPDGIGPAPCGLVASGRFTSAAGLPASNIAFWDGARWSAMGGGLNSPASSMTSWDPDGAGPLLPRLVAMGSFTSAGGVPVTGIASWDGSAWAGVGSSPGGLRFVRSVDLDGNGPQAPTLLCSRSQLVRWTGSAWTQFGTALSDVRDAAVFDPDGDGPLPERVAVIGNFSRLVNGQLVERVALWNGTDWQSLPGLPATAGIDRVVVWDPDGGGPASPLVVVRGGPYAFDGSTWTTLVGGAAIPSYYDLAVADFDGDGPGLPQLFALFPDTQDPSGQYAAYTWSGGAWVPASWASGTRWSTFGSRRGARSPVGEYLIVSHVWGEVVERVGGAGGYQRPVGIGIAGTVYSSAKWDPDGEGPLSPWMVFGGDFRVRHDGPLEHLVAYDGSDWRSMGTANAPVRGLTLWDPDGDGPLRERLVAGGEFTRIGGVDANRVAMWDGVAWSAMGPGFAGGSGARVSLLTTWDPDGGGPVGPQLIAGGTFVASGATPVSSIAHWNAAASEWASLGSGLNGVPTGMVAWDPDGEGPEHDLLVVGGGFSTAGGELTKGVSAWDGVRWTRFEERNGNDGAVAGLVAYDPDGGGPDRAQLWMVGNLYYADTGTTVFGGRWDGFRWASVPASPELRRLFSLDPDLDGPMGPVLLAEPALRFWTGRDWKGLDVSSVMASRDITSVAAWINPATPEQGPRIVVTGRLSDATGVSANGAIAISDWLGSMGDPASAAVCPGGETLLASEWFSQSPVQCEWRYRPAGHGEFQVVTEGVNGSPPLFEAVGRVDGVGLELRAIGGSTEFRCEAHSECGVRSTGVTTVRVCPTDLDCSGGVDGDDVIAFFQLWELGDLRADFDGSGGVDADDTSVFFAAWDAGCSV